MLTDDVAEDGRHAKPSVVGTGSQVQLRHILIVNYSVIYFQPEGYN